MRVFNGDCDTVCIGSKPAIGDSGDSELDCLSSGNGTLETILDVNDMISLFGAIRISEHNVLIPKARDSGRECELAGEQQLQPVVSA